MKKLLCTLLIVLMLISGCIPANPFTNNLDQLTSEECAEINEKGQGRKATLIMRSNEKEIEVEQIRVEIDSLYWINPNSRLQTSVPTSIIKEIKITDYVQGLTYGLLAGAVLWTLYFVIPTEEKSGEPLEVWFNEGINSIGHTLSLIFAIALPASFIIGGVEHTWILPDQDMMEPDTTKNSELK